MLKHIFLLSIFFLGSCDFSTRIHRQVLEAQELIFDQKYEEAISQYYKILKRDPSKETQVKIYYQLGDLYSIYLSKNLEAIKHYLKVKELTSDPFWLIKTEERLGEVFFSYLKRYREAAGSYKLLSGFNPPLENQDYYEYREALSWFNLGEMETAKERFLKIIKNSKHKFLIDCYYYIGQINFRQKNWKEAIKPFSLFAKKSRNIEKVVQAKFLIANSYETLEDLEKAYMLYYSLLGVYPNPEVIKNRLESIYRRRIARKR